MSCGKIWQKFRPDWNYKLENNTNQKYMERKKTAVHSEI